MKTIIPVVYDFDWCECCGYCASQAVPDSYLDDQTDDFIRDIMLDRGRDAHDIRKAA